MPSRVHFSSLRQKIAPHLPQLVWRILPNGRRQGNEWLALNPRRDDRHLGSFKVNLKTGQWADFASGDKGGDVISLYGFLHDCSQTEAARRLASILGLSRGTE